MIYLSLFLVFLRISIFSFGGGAASIPLIEEQVVQNYHWLTRSEFLDILALVQLVPGNISANMAIMIGFQKAGILGGLSALLGYSIFAMMVVSTLFGLLYKWREHYYQKAVFLGLIPATVACIFYACFIIGEISLKNDIGGIEYYALGILMICALCQFIFKLPSFIMIALSIILSIFLL